MENLEPVMEFIVGKELVQKGQRIGVGVSGGVDSMTLLAYLNSVRKELGIEIVAVHVNHNIRPTARKEALFVAKYCKANGIDHVSFSVDVPAYSRENKSGIEEAARILRYDSYAQAIRKKKLDKLATGHHMGDQAETILLNIFRGSGITGAGGMQPMRGCFIRPFLEISKQDIIAYAYRNQIPYMPDESNDDNTFRRNFLRNEVMPILQREWRGVERNIVDFGKNCRTDDEYMDSLVDTAYFQISENVVRIPLTMFIHDVAVCNRVVIKGAEKIGLGDNIEKKHIEMVVALAKSGENGSRVDLPNGVYATREYEYLAIVRKVKASTEKIYPFKIGKTSFAEFGTISVTKTISFKLALQRGIMVIDVDRLPRQAKWRTRKDGDTFTKFGGKTKNLNAYLIDQKVPSRLRDQIPVLALDNEIYAVAGHEISEKVRTDHNTVEAYVVEIIKD